MSVADLSAEERQWLFSDLIRSLTELVGTAVRMGMDPMEAHRMSGAVLSFVIEPLGMQKQFDDMQKLSKNLQAFNDGASNPAPVNDTFWPDDLAATTEV